MELEIERSADSPPKIVAVPSHENGTFEVPILDHSRTFRRIEIQQIAKKRLAKAFRTGDTSELKKYCFHTTPKFPNFISFTHCIGIVPVEISRKPDFRYVTRMNEYDPHDHHAEPEEGYLGLKQAEMRAELKRRNATEAVRRQCVDLIRDFAYFDKEPDIPTLNLPAVKWNDDGSDLLHLMPNDGQMGDTLTDEALAEVDESIHWAQVPELDVVFLGHRDDSITIARIELYGGPDNTAIIRDFVGNFLTSDELKALHSDLLRYRELAEQGRFEDNSPSKA